MVKIYSFCQGLLAKISFSILNDSKSSPSMSITRTRKLVPPRSRAMNLPFSTQRKEKGKVKQNDLLKCVRFTYPNHQGHRAHKLGTS